MSRPTWARWVTRVSLALAVVALVLTIRDTGLIAIGTYFKRIGWGWFAVVIMEVAIVRRPMSRIVKTRATTARISEILVTHLAHVGRLILETYSRTGSRR